MLATVAACPAGSAPAAPAPSPPTSSALEQASALLNDGKYAPAEGVLEQLVQRGGRASAQGANASYLLMSAYGMDGRYQDALREATALLAALPHTAAAPRTAPASRHSVPADWPDRTQVEGQRQAFAESVREDARLQAILARTADPAAALALRGQIASHRLQTEEAAADYLAAFRLLPHDSQATQPDRLLVEGNFFSHLVSVPGLTGTARSRLVTAWGFGVLEEAAALPARRRLALAQLTGSVVDPPISPEGPAARSTQVGSLERLRRDLTALNRGASSPPVEDAGIRDLLGRVQARLSDFGAASTLARAGAALALAVKAEETGDGSAAAAAYRLAASEADPAPDPTGQTPPLQSLPLQQIEAAARRAIPLMTARADLAAPSATDKAVGSFLGVDSTLGGDWRGTVGTEGWVLFALHGDDLCGGPRLLDHSFSYRVRSGDASDPPRRWRDPAGYRSRPREDLPLADPAAPGGRAVSFVDDHGEAYPQGAGPDLYVDLTVPAGRHLLSLPLHFSDPADTAASYALYLMAPGVASDARKGTTVDVDRCLAARVVSVRDAPGFVRAAVQGPAHYILIIRRLGSLNANLPALFLDPDSTGANPTPLSSAFGPEELAALPEPDVKGGGQPGGLSSLRGLRREYEQGGLTPERWADLAGRASKLSGFSGLDAGQQAVAAWVAWQAQERDPLHTAVAADLFSHYLTLRFPIPPQVPTQASRGVVTGGLGPALEAQQAALRALAGQMRGAGRTRLAELADDAVWERQSRLAAEGGSNPASAAASLWDAGPRLYLAEDTVWLWQGDGGPGPQPLSLALDAEYAARKAPALTRYVLTGDAAALVGRSDTAAAPAAGTLVAADGPAADGARRWLDYFGGWLGLTLGPALQDTDAAPEATRTQPLGPLLYAAACGPLVDLAPGSAGNAAGARCLLRTDQAELLARCFLSHGLFATGAEAADRDRAMGLLHWLKAHDPQYPRLAQVDALLVAWGPKPP